MRKIIIFIEPSENAYDKSTNIGNLYMNRFAIDEEVACEILNIYELEKRQQGQTRKEKAKDLDI